MCAFDTLAIVLRIVVYLFAGHSLREAFQRTVLARIGEPITVGDDKFINWVSYAVGVAPAYIKLVGFQGMPWTKAWGSMFVASYVANEALSVLGARQSPANPYVPEAQKKHDSADTSADQKTSAPSPGIPNRLHKYRSRAKMVIRLVRMDSIFYAIAMLLHLVLVVSIASDLLKIIRTTHQGERIWAVITSSNTTLSVSILVPYALSSQIFVLRHVKHTGMRRDLVVVAAFSMLGLIPYLLGKAHDTDDLRRTLLAINAIAVGAVLLRGLTSFLMRSRTLAVQLFCIEPGHEDESHNVWILFVLTLLLTTYWYAYCYNPSGTYKPEWANIFG
jgi:hypothetical protein